MIVVTRYLFLTITLLSASILQAQISHPDLAFNTYKTGFAKPVDIVNAGDGSNRLFVVEQSGYIKIIKDDIVLSNYFLNLDDLIPNLGNYDERGLLGLAFHPDYENNGYFYVHYTDLSSDTQVSRFSVDPMNPDQADPESELPMLNIYQPASNHNGGCVRFGPDGYLYIGMGDGGSQGDPSNYAQNLQSMLGKMLRIDVDGGTPYAIPADNPYVNDANALNEIWSFGWRNPWRYSFDKLTGDLWVADVGQNTREEIDFQPASSTGAGNYGWRCYEGTNSYNQSECSGITGFIDPIFEFPHDFSTGGLSVTGGCVYRGGKYSCFQGFYIFADYVTDNVWTTTADGTGGWDTHRHTNVSPSPQNVSSFGEDEAGEIYALNLSAGIVYKVQLQNDVLAIDDVPIPTNNYVSVHAITSAGTVPNANIVDFIASDYILLEAGFSVEVGGYFDATVQPCVPLQNP